MMSPNRHCVSDPMTSNLLVAIADDIATILTALHNKSLHDGVIPLFKKSNLDPTDVKSYTYTPIGLSNLSVTSKRLERLVAILAKPLVSHLKAHDLFRRMQSIFHRGHSTETAVTIRHPHCYRQGRLRCPIALLDLTAWLAAWRSGNGVGHINEVTLRQAQLVLGWVTCTGSTP